MKRNLIISDDGSHTIKVEELNERYHSIHGAIAESRHVFIEAGLYKALETGPGNLNILEIGFGTGLNALLTVLDDKARKCEITYTGLEAFPLEKEIWENINYPELIDADTAREVFSKLHESQWDEFIDLSTGFRLKKIKEKLEKYHHEGLCELVYFDAFGPDVQPELWTEEIFHRIAAITRKGGILVTYSCKGSVKRALRSAGFEIEKLPGPKGKREMLRGVRF